MAVGPAMRTPFASILSWFPAVARDILGVFGLGSVAYGCWLLFPAAGFIVGGLESVTVCALLAAAAGRG